MQTPFETLLREQQQYRWGSNYGSFRISQDVLGNVTQVHFDGPGATLPFISISLVTEQEALRRGEDPYWVQWFSDAKLLDMHHLTVQAEEAGEDHVEGVGFTAIEIMFLIGTRGVNTHHQGRATLEIDC